MEAKSLWPCCSQNVPTPTRQIRMIYPLGSRPVSRTGSPSNIFPNYNTVYAESKSETCTGNAEMIRDDANNEDSGALRMPFRRGVDAVDHQGRTALHLTAASGILSTVKLLPDKESIDCGALDHRNSTPLYAAAMGGHFAVVDLLLRRTKASVKCKDIGGNTRIKWCN
jgi:hypothetical protein